MMTFENARAAESPPWRFRAANHPDILPVRAFQDNYIWLMAASSRNGERLGLVVDPGEAAPVVRALKTEGLPLAGILITHHHADHTGGLEDLKAAWPRAVVYGPRKCRNPFIERRFDHGDAVMIDGTSLRARVIEVPGHTLDHNAYFFDRIGSDPRPVLFCGDTLFAGGCGRVFEGTPEVMFQSLKRLAALPPATLVYCAHEYTLANLRFARAAEPASDPVAARLREAEAIRATGTETVPSTLEVELQTNPFLRVREPSILAALGRRNKVDAADEVGVFAALRQWKNDFK
jgi:hydroxyacylglutathione hydrolase